MLNERVVDSEQVSTRGDSLCGEKGAGPTSRAQPPGKLILQISVPDTKANRRLMAWSAIVMSELSSTCNRVRSAIPKIYCLAASQPNVGCRD